MTMPLLEEYQFVLLILTCGSFWHKEKLSNDMEYLQSIQ